MSSASTLIRLSLGLLSGLTLAMAQPSSLSLAGSWAFRLDPEKSGHRMNWQDYRFEDAVVFLPGSTDQAGFGMKTTGPAPGWLSRPWIYEGPAWYQREVVVPEGWRGKRIVLFLERPHWQTEVWVDGKAFGSQNSLATPHVYDLTEALSPGRHRLTLCVDNTYKIEVGRNAHSVTEHTQTNWNGVVGRIELQVTDPVWVESVQVYPDVAAKSLRIQATVRNATGLAANGSVAASLGEPGAQPVTARFSNAGQTQDVTITMPLISGIRLWDEYESALYPLSLSLTATAGSNSFRDKLERTVGFRHIATANKQFLLNGRPIFLRGTLECNIFPATGYPAMDVAGWERLFRIARSYGLNHFRFHSWCPPEAAFEAADRAGFLLHVELPVWSNRVGKDQALDDFMRAEGHRILNTYGNHPSFTMLCLGNELTGEWSVMDNLVDELKRSDPRRLYTFSADHRRRGAGPTSDYYVTHNTASGPVRIHGSRFQKSSGSTDYDFANKVAEIPMPLVAHELGQWVVYPNFDEISKYTGVLKPRNLEVFRDQLAARGMADQSADFQLASGRFSWLMYKEDIETALRTPNFGGVQLLQLHDFPGQGEALIGLLDSFWDSKGILSPAEMRRFFDQTVLLLRLPKFVWTNNETFTSRAQIAHYGKSPASGAVVEWDARDDSGKVIGSGKLAPANLPLGSVTNAGEVSIRLADVRAATRVRISLRLVGTQITNSWDIWVYPQTVNTAPADSVSIARAFDQETRRKLSEGVKVLLVWPRGQTGKNTMESRFLPVFWSLSWFRKQPGTLGILCDPAHPALASFPTDMHSNWQWWEVTEGAPAFVLNETPHGFRPIIQVIDDYHRNYKLGAVYETKVGKGSLLVSSFDLESDLESRPVARQLRSSLLSYMNSAAFAPRQELEPGLLEKLLAPQEAPK